MNCLLSFDVEDWFHVHNFSDYIDSSSWHTMEYRVNENIDLILKLLDENNVKATFFVLGWVAEIHPALVKKIYTEGHEIASHGYSHRLSFTLSKSELKEDIYKAKAILENVTGEEISGFRAPSFTISEVLIELLTEFNFKYDSSFLVSVINKNYGKLKGYDTIPIKNFQLNDKLTEFPLNSISLAGLKLPWSGGAVFRAVPFNIFRTVMNKVLEKNNYYLFYMHPWEFDTMQPVLKNIKFHHKVKHYYNIDKTLNKFKLLLDNYNFKPINQCS